MKTLITLVVDHKKPIPDLSNLIAHRAYTLDAVSNVTVLFEGQTVDSTNSSIKSNEQ